MEDFVKIYVHSKTKNGDYKVNFRRVRDLAMFAINYENTIEQDNAQEEEQITIDDILTLTRRK